MKYGAEGYGIYFMILERLRDEKNYMSVKDYNVLAFDLRVDAGKVKSIVEDFGLFAFTDDGECFYSEGFNKRMEIKDEKSKKRSEAGKKGAERRWQKNSNANGKAKVMSPDSDSKESKGKETKGKESKESSESSNTKHSESSAVRYWLNQVNPAEAPMIIESIDYWVKDFNGQDKIVILAIDEMLQNGAKSYKYLDRVLKSWESAKLDTPEKVKNHLAGGYNKTSSSKSFGGQNRQWTAKKLFDYWWAEKMGGKPSLEDFVQKYGITEQEKETLKFEIEKRGMGNALS